MDKRKYMFQKKVNKGDIFFRFVFVGTPNKDNFIYDNIINVIDNCFDKLVFYGNMEKNISLIRTIFSDFEETNLCVEVITPSYKENIRYSNKKLAIYNLERTVNLNKFNDIFSVNYVIGRGISFSFSDNEYNMISGPFINGYKKLLNETMEKLHRLTNIETIKLNKDSKQLCEMYKLFYGEVPDFTDDNIYLLVQCMVSILNQFNIKLGYKNNYRFHLPIDEKMPICFELNELINDLELFGKLDISDDDSKLNIETKKIIKVIGNYVQEYINNSGNRFDSLIGLSTIFYLNNYNNSGNFNVDRISEFTKYPSEQIENSLKLVKRIDRKITSR